MVIFHSYVSLPEGNRFNQVFFLPVMQPDSFLESFDSTMWSRWGVGKSAISPQEVRVRAKDVPSITSFHSIYPVVI